jgi:hypothetical protein
MRVFLGLTALAVGVVAFTGASPPPKSSAPELRSELAPAMPDHFMPGQIARLNGLAGQ